MDKIESLIKEYSSVKLKEIVGQQSSSYSEKFIDYSKDELIRRGESFTFNVELENEISAMNDIDLKNLVEKEWNNFHLEYLEIARKEYLKRGFKNTTTDDTQNVEMKDDEVKKYPALRTIAVIYIVFAWVVGIVAALISFYVFSNNGNILISIPTLVIGALIVLLMVATAESIKVFIDIENNTRLAAK